MPIISTNDVQLHKRLKKTIVDTNFTLGKAVDRFIKVGLAIGALDMDDRELQQAIENWAKLNGQPG